MLKLAKLIPAIALVAGFGLLAFAGSGCEGKFAGPPGGSAIGTPGLNPLFGVTTYTFRFEDPTETGFYNDVWHMDSGRDADDGPSGRSTIIADSIDAMETATFSGFVTNRPDPRVVEGNFVYAMMTSLMSQWFRRNGDGSRILELDQFGQLAWSDKSLDINIIVSPLEVFLLQPPPTFYFTVMWFIYPDSPFGQIPGWSSPPPEQIGGTPSPQRRFMSRDYSQIGALNIGSMLPAGSPLLTQSLGLPIPDDVENENVENAGAVPIEVTSGGGQWSVPSAPIGVFADNFALAYRVAPVIRPSSPGHDEFQAAVEYARHLGALHTNLLVQMIGLNSGEEGTLTDTGQVVWQNGFGYSFVQDDLNVLKGTHLPGKWRDPTRDP
jgi:hypothetical protein